MRRSLFASLLLGGTLLAAPAEAQLADAKILTIEAAKKAMAAAEGEARKNSWAVSIAIVDAHGELVMFQKLDGASLSSVDIARGKARTAARARRETKAYGDALTEGRLGVLSFEGVIAVEGGVPIIVNGQVVGAIGVSGVTSAQDAQVAKAGVAVVTP